MGDKKLRIGLTEAHGMAHEASRVPPEGVCYEFLKVTARHHGLLRTPIKCSLRRYDDAHVDIVEAILGPAITDRPWICSLDCFEAAMAFSLLGFPLPKSVRRRYLERLFLRDNFKQLIFWSKAAKESLTGYGEVENEEPLRKSTVVYPAVREAPRRSRPAPAEGLRLLFSGDFFRKGGANVVDAFEILQRDFPAATLRLCCDERIDFNTPNQELRHEYLHKISRNDGIIFGRASREAMLEETLPQTDMYLLPTYAEAFGFAILEAMSYAIPVVATDVFAIPEIIEDGISGILIDTREFDLKSICKGYVVKHIPGDFKERMTHLLVVALRRLAESPDLRTRLGEAARQRAQTHFSFERRNRDMSRIYSVASA